MSSKDKLYKERKLVREKYWQSMMQMLKMEALVWKVGAVPKFTIQS